eukprot:3537022-Prymnesium_polylepis.1
MLDVPSLGRKHRKPLRGLPGVDRASGLYRGGDTRGSDRRPGSSQRPSYGQKHRSESYKRLHATSTEKQPTCDSHTTAMLRCYAGDDQHGTREVCNKRAAALHEQMLTMSRR